LSGPKPLSFKRKAASTDVKIAIVVAVIVVACIVGILLARSRDVRPRPAPIAGGIYSVNGDDAGHFGVIKVLRVDPKGVHVSMYQNKFSNRPTNIDESKLTFGTIHNAEPPGIMHVPLSNAAYNRLAARFVQQSKVGAEELAIVKDEWGGDGGFWP
jgi:hypothetical protein